MRMSEDVLKMKRSRNLGFDREYYKKRIAAELYPGEWETAMNTVTRLGRYTVKNANVKE